MPEKSWEPVLNVEQGGPANNAGRRIIFTQEREMFWTSGAQDSGRLSDAHGPFPFPYLPPGLTSFVEQGSSVDDIAELDDAVIFLVQDGSNNPGIPLPNSPIGPGLGYNKDTGEIDRVLFSFRGNVIDPPGGTDGFNGASVSNVRSDGARYAVVCGSFDYAKAGDRSLLVGDYTAVNNIVLYDHLAGTVSTLGGGIDNDFTDALFSNGDIIIYRRNASFITDLPGVGIARWTGAAWVPMGTGVIGLDLVGDPGRIHDAIEHPNGQDVIVVGPFVSVGGVAAEGSAVWRRATNTWEPFFHDLSGTITEADRDDAWNGVSVTQDGDYYHLFTPGLTLPWTTPVDPTVVWRVPVSSPADEWEPIGQVQGTAFHDGTMASGSPPRSLDRQVNPVVVVGWGFTGNVFTTSVRMRRPPGTGNTQTQEDADAGDAVGFGDWPFYASTIIRLGLVGLGVIPPLRQRQRDDASRWLGGRSQVSSKRATIRHRGYL